MHGKIYRFILIETVFRSRFAIFLAIIIFSLFQIVAISVINKNIEGGEMRKALIINVPEMEGILYPGGLGRETALSIKPADPIKINGKLYALKGIRELEGGLSALINEDVYQVDDVIQDYRIAKITPDTVLFKHIKTGGMKILRFGF